MQVKYGLTEHAHLTYPSVPVKYIMEFYTNFDFLGKYSFMFLIKHPVFLEG